MKSFLVATDFSLPAKEAGRYAAQLARESGASIILLHAYMLPAPVSEVPYIMISVDEVQKDNEKLAQEQASELEAISGSAVQSMVKIGMPADEILYQAKELEVDLIITGMRGENTGIDKFIGSTTAAIIRKSNIPVLVIPAGTVFMPTHTITYATDFSYTMNQHSLSTLQMFMKMNATASLQVVNVQKTGESLNADQHGGKLKLIPMLEAMNHQFSQVESDSVEDGVEEFLDSHPSQLLVMLAHKHPWWSRLLNASHTREMVYRAHIPMLVLQDKD